MDRSLRGLKSASFTDSGFLLQAKRPITRLDIATRDPGAGQHAMDVRRGLGGAGEEANGHRLLEMRRN
jgi:hypothetical protein